MRRQGWALGVQLGLFSLTAAQAQSTPEGEPGAAVGEAQPPSPSSEAPAAPPKAPQVSHPSPFPNTAEGAWAPRPGEARDAATKDEAQRVARNLVMSTGASAALGLSGALVGTYVGSYFARPRYCGFICQDFAPEVVTGAAVGAVAGVVLGAAGGSFVAETGHASAQPRGGARLDRILLPLVGATAGALGCYAFAQMQPEAQRGVGPYLLMPVMAGVGAVLAHEVDLALRPPPGAQGLAGVEATPALTPVPGGAMLGLQGRF